MPRDNLPKVVQDCHDLLTWLIPLLDHFPRNRRFTLGERLENSLIEILELLVEAAYSRTKQQVLQRANTRLAVVRHLWRMAHELETIPGKRYAHGVKLIDDLGNRSVSGRNKPQNVCSANRNRNAPDNRNNNVGFRLASPPACCQGIPEPCESSVAYGYPERASGCPWHRLLACQDDAAE